MQPSDYILDIKQVAEVYGSAQKPTPFVLSHKDDTRCFILIGVEHTNDPAHSMFKTLREEWEGFLFNAKDSKKVVFTEGGVRPVAKTQEEAIKKYGEPGALSFWADQRGIGVFTPEPKRGDELNELLKRFSMEEVELYYFVRQVDQWQRQSQSDFEGYMHQFFRSKTKNFPNRDFEFTLTNLIDIYEQKIGRSFDENSPRWFHELSNPILSQYITQRVAEASSNYRDKNIADKLVEAYLGGTSVYSVYGSSHVYAFEPVFKRYIQPH